MACFSGAFTAGAVLDGFDLRDERYMVTGVSQGGIEAEIAKALVRRGAYVEGTRETWKRAGI